MCGEGRRVLVPSPPDRVRFNKCMVYWDTGPPSASGQLLVLLFRWHFRRRARHSNRSVAPDVRDPIHRSSFKDWFPDFRILSFSIVCATCLSLHRIERWRPPPPSRPARSVFDLFRRVSPARKSRRQGSEQPAAAASVQSGGGAWRRAGGFASLRQREPRCLRFFFLSHRSPLWPWPSGEVRPTAQLKSTGSGGFSNGENPEREPVLFKPARGGVY